MNLFQYILSQKKFFFTLQGLGFKPRSRFNGGKPCTKSRVFRKALLFAFCSAQDFMSRIPMFQSMTCALDPLGKSKSSANAYRPLVLWLNICMVRSLCGEILYIFSIFAADSSHLFGGPAEAGISCTIIGGLWGDL